MPSVTTCALKIVAGDDVDELARLFALAAASADLVVCTGGLGPTDDDITRDALSRASDIPLDIDEAIVNRHSRAV